MATPSGPPGVVEVLVGDCAAVFVDEPLPHATIERAATKTPVATPIARLALITVSPRPNSCYAVGGLADEGLV